MSFLAPWYLMLAGAALVPLLIHLLRRRIGVHVEFPAARYLARAAGGVEARQAAVLTDGQRTRGVEPQPNRGNDAVLVWAPSELAPVNRAVVLAEASPLRWTPRGAIAARILSPDSATYRMALGPR